MASYPRTRISAQNPATANVEPLAPPQNDPGPNTDGEPGQNSPGPNG